MGTNRCMPLHQNLYAGNYRCHTFCPPHPTHNLADCPTHNSVCHPCPPSRTMLHSGQERSLPFSASSGSHHSLSVQQESPVPSSSEWSAARGCRKGRVHPRTGALPKKKDPGSVCQIVSGAASGEYEFQQSEISAAKTFRPLCKPAYTQQSIDFRLHIGVGNRELALTATPGYNRSVESMGFVYLVT